MEHNDIVVGEAIRKELARGGQVLYLYNRVETMERPLAKLSRQFPDARIAVAHGKMEKEALEDIWQSLVRGEIDLLLCTTIVETGVDLPNANTLIIEDADRMGLSQLHQLRGRVGRSGRHAYAYFTYRRGKELSEIAEKRLKAIREYAEFGAGFKIALRDLEIRGAGNLLGAEQHGHHIDAVGYDLYMKILNEAVLEEKGVLPEEVFESQIDLPCDAHIPERYIAASAHRMEMYKKISHVLTEEDERDVTDELCDRFGEPPLPTRRLLWVALSRAIASRAKISKIEKKDGALRFLAATPDLSVWSELLHKSKSLRFAATSAGPAMTYRLSAGEDAVEVLYKLMVAYERAKTAQDANKT
jgi:transcription-repair coupling factor (superfamily II helicase)